MKDEYGRGDKLRLRVASKLSESLVRAVDEGDREALGRAIAEQPITDITEMINHRLVARAFLVEEKGELVALGGRLDNQKTTQEAIRQVRDYLHALKSNFIATFATEDGGSEFGKLTGDRLFREALQQPGDEGMELARHLMNIDLTTLTSADMVFHWMKAIRGDITESLWGVVQDMREGAADKELLQTVLSEETTSLDAYIMMTLQQV